MSDFSLLDLRAEAGDVERLYERSGIEPVTSMVIALGLNVSPVTPSTVAIALLDGLATRLAAVMARDLHVFDLDLGNVAHGLHRQMLVVGAAVETLDRNPNWPPSTLVIAV